MADFTIERIGDSIDLLGEGVVWDAPSQRLYWVDAYSFLIHELDLSSGKRRDFSTNGLKPGCLAIRESGGAIVATASISADHPTPPLGAYAASKAALVRLVEQMAIEWGPVGIRCNCVSPGPTLTGMTSRGYADAARRAQRESTIPLRRLGTAADIAGAVLFLLGTEAAFINGINLIVDGGLGRNLMPASGAGTGQTPPPSTPQ